MSSQISTRLTEIKKRLAVAAPGRSIEIVAAAKFQPIARLQAAADAGIKIFGENYAQDGEAKQLALKAQAVEWHFIGHIQSRKVKYLVDYACVQSLDRLEIAQALNQRLLALNRKISGLVEVNVGGESQKSGVPSEDLSEFLQQLKSLPQLKIRGLMSMPPALEPLELRRPYFRQLKKLYDLYAPLYAFDTLSIGTSEDFEIAASEGGTMIRLGTQLLGARN